MASLDIALFYLINEHSVSFLSNFIDVATNDSNIFTSVFSVIRQSFTVKHVGKASELELARAWFDSNSARVYEVYEIARELGWARKLGPTCKP